MDRQSCITRLSHALSSEAKCLSEVALALGYCRLYGVDPGAMDGTLTIEQAVGAIKAWIRRLKRATQDAERLTECVAAADMPSEAEDACDFLVQTRMDSWAAFLAIEESYQVTLKEEGRDKMLSTLLAGLLATMGDYDQALNDQQAVLTTWLGGRPNRYWAENIAEEYSGNLAWWVMLG